MYIHQHRKDGGHARYGKPNSLRVKGESRADLEMQPAVAPTPEPPATQHHPPAVTVPPPATQTKAPYPTDD